MPFPTYDAFLLMVSFQSKMMRELKDFLGEGISFEQYRILESLTNTLDHELSCGQIRNKFLGSPDITRIIDRLVRKELVQRYTPEGDRRTVLVRLTPKGKKLAQLTKKQIEIFCSHYFRSMATQDLNDLRVVISRIRDGR